MKKPTNNKNREIIKYMASLSPYYCVEFDDNNKPKYEIKDYLNIKKN